MASFSPEGGLFTGLLASEVISGAAIDTLRFATAGQGVYVYLAGGENAAGELSSRVWRGRVGQSPTTGQIVFVWSELEVAEAPAGRKNAILVADPERQRLLLLLGETDGGASDEAYAFDLQSGAWSSLHLDLGGPRQSSCYSVASGKLAFYGGSDGSQDLDGLYLLDLATLELERLDR